MTDTVGLLSAMLAVQGEAPTLPKDATNPHYKSKYTPLDTIVEKIGPILNRHGLVWSTLPGRDEHGDPALTYRLSHAPTGEVLEGTMPLLLSKQDAQGQGSAITYARRYALCAVLNLVADDDDDGARAAAGRTEQGQQPRVLHGEATDKQKMAIRRAIKQHGLNEHETRVVFKGAGVPVADDELINDAIATLSKQQASTLLDTLKEGAVKTGGSDVPSDAGEFTHPPEQDPLPVSA